jgi:eukaryotic-like serine/threonine-protein kinase
MESEPSKQSGAGVREGDIVAGKYQVEKILGIGGMGVVVAARHLQLEDKVALKFLRPEVLSNPEAVARFVREARAAVRIKSEHVARVTDVGTLENGAPYMVMEYLEGGDLAGWLEQRGPLPIDLAVEFVLQASVAVAEAHALGIVHRDLKPANLFCMRRSDGQLSIKVLDFGISKLTDMSGTSAPLSMTKTNTMMGSPFYMSPEQMQSSKGVDARTDIWALGIVLFELIAGRGPFQAESVVELAVKIATEPPEALHTCRPEVPPGLEAVVGKCLERDAERRYHHVGELALALLPFATKRAKESVDRISGIVQSAGLSMREPSMHAQAPNGTLLPVGRTTAGGRRGKSLMIWVGFAAVLAAAGSSFATLSWSKAPGHAYKPQPATAGLIVTPAALQEPPRLPPLAMPVDAGSVYTDVTRLPPPPPAILPSPAEATKKRAPASAPAQPSAKVNCNPPFYYDAVGHKQYKVECM